MELMPNSSTLPLWVCPNGRIYLETFSSKYRQAYDFVIAIAEPVCRPRHVQEYQLTPHSLYGAVSTGLTSETIIKALQMLSKVRVPIEIQNIIRTCTSSYGKVKLILRKNKYFCESKSRDVLNRLVGDGLIRDALAPLNEGCTSYISSSTIDTEKKFSSMNPAAAILQGDDDSDDEEQGHKSLVHSFEITPPKVEGVKKRCVELEYPLLEEYDFRNDTNTPDLKIDLKPTTIIRPYQEKSLSQMFSNGRARSGLIVLPCGAGKSLVGVTAACTIKKSTLLLCTNSVSVDQWREQFRMWSTIQDNQISRFTSELKEGMSVDTAGVTITTYTMLTFSGKRNHKSADIIKKLQDKEWGLLVLDEVHVVPAVVFRKVLSVVASHCKLGLTATLVREDKRIGDLNFLIGPKLYEANWLDLVSAGYIANVQCVEVWCQMTEAFYKAYLTSTDPRQQQLLYVMNPNKFQACQYLMQFHENRGDKVIVFSDNIDALKHYAKMLQRPFIYGPTSNQERLAVLEAFKNTSKIKSIFISRVGDNSIDLPEANVVIQISSHFGSRRQEAQRLGRILRPKSRMEGGFNAFFYTLVSTDTHEMYFSTRRQQFLVDQGYAFKVVRELQDMDQANLLLKTPKDQDSLLAQVLGAQNEDEEEFLRDKDDITRHPAAKRSTRSARSLAGGEGRVYAEVKKSKKAKGPTNAVMRQYFNTKKAARDLKKTPPPSSS
ncbi:transcription factor IIH subunit [Pelomyxa schiedti]|nr:transcription factor IIH subunit [Pelomyxa schiedti]